VPDEQIGRNRQDFLLQDHAADLGLYE
jgi:hypothetical protein